MYLVGLGGWLEVQGYLELSFGVAGFCAFKVKAKETTYYYRITESLGTRSRFHKAIR